VLLLLLLAGCSVLVRYSVMLLHLTVTFLLAEGPEEDVFVGRAAELDRLADVVARVRRGQPWLVTIEGESGVRWRRRPA